MIYNPGTEAAHTIIRLAGNVGEGLTIRNLTTGQGCKVQNLTSGSLLEGACLELDSRMGQTRIALGEQVEMAFPFHEEGYITLAPCTPFVRSMTVCSTAGNNEVTSAGGFMPHMKGQYLYLDGWRKITQVTDSNHAIVLPAPDKTGKTDTPVVTMNEIELSGEGVNLTRFEIDYVPRVE